MRCYSLASNRVADKHALEMPDKSLHSALRNEDFVITAQLLLNEDTGRDGVLAQARSLAPSVDAISVPANPHGVVHMAGLAVASLLLAEGIDPVLHVASRDQNRIAIRSDLLGAAAIGVTSIVLERGDRMSQRLRPRAKTGKPAKIGALKMLKAAQRLSEYQVQQGAPELNLGTLATVVEPGEDWQPQALTIKADAGARFLQTRLCADAGLVRRYAAALVEEHFTHRCRVIVSVPVLPSAEAARWINEHRQTEVIPASVIRRIDNAASPQREGVEIAVELLQALRSTPGISGANLVSQGDVGAIADVIAAARTV